MVTETFPPEVNGVAMTLGNLVRGLQQRGHMVQLVRPRQEHETVALHGIDQVLATGIPIPRYPEMRFGLLSQSRLIRLWRQRRPDVVHVATEGPLGWCATAAARKLQLPVTSSFHTNFHQYSGHYGMGLLKMSIEAYLRKFHNRTLVTMAPTESAANMLEGLGYRNVSVLSRGVAVEQFTPRLRSDELRRAWGARENDIVVLYVGRLAKEKNAQVVLNAFSAIQARLPSARLVFVGDGPLRMALQEACPQAIFAGIKSGKALAAHYASGDLFLFPSLTETFGNVVPEALASGLAVVSYACAAAAQLIRNGHNGALVAPDDEMAFINTAVELATDDRRRDTLRREAAASVAHMSWSSVTDTFVGTLRSSVHRHQARFKSPIGLLQPSRVSQPSA